MRKKLNFKINKNLLNKTALLNRKISDSNLTYLNFGNGSILDKKKNTIYIKGSGFDTKLTTDKKIAVCNFSRNCKLKKRNKIKPSVDTLTHVYLYLNLKNVFSIIHTHSKYATILAQANVEPECLGTTHADFFSGKIPLSNKISVVDKKNHEIQLGRAIIDKLKKGYENSPGILLRDHGFYAWGEDYNKALENAIAFETICMFYFYTKIITKKKFISNNYHKFHYLRKNGENKFYGQ